MNENEKEEIEADIEAKYVDKTEKEFLSRVTYAECLYILTPANKYCDKIKELSVLKIGEIIEKLLKGNEELNLKYSMLYNGKIEKMKAQEVKIKSQVIPVYKVKDKIKKLRAEYEYLGEENKRVNKFEIELLQELIKGD